MPRDIQQVISVWFATMCVCVAYLSASSLAVFFFFFFFFFSGGGGGGEGDRTQQGPETVCNQEGLQVNQSFWKRVCQGSLSCVITITFHVAPAMPVL